MIADMFTATNTQMRLSIVPNRRRAETNAVTEQCPPTRNGSSIVANGDPAYAFAQLAHERLNGALVRCEERYPQAAPFSVLLVVVNRNPGQWREKLNSLHSTIFGPGKTDSIAPTRLEVIDSAADETIQRLVAAGLFIQSTRASRPLFPARVAAVPPLSDAEREQIAVHRADAVHKLELARILGNAGFAAEARPALLDAVYSFGCALALENCAPEPLAVYDVVIPPLSHHWKDALPVVASFVNGTGTEWQPVVAQLAKV
jgi:hypothetical protein